MKAPLSSRPLIFLLALLCAHSAFAASPVISLQTISSGQLVSPVYLTNAGDGSNRLFVCDQVGKIRVIQDGMLLPTPLLDLSAKLVPQVTSYDETGLLCVAFHPGFSNPNSPGYKKFYVFYSAVSPNACNPTTISAISTGNPCTITTSTPHGLTTNASAEITGVSGGTFSPAINNSLGASYVVTVIDAYNFTVPVNCTSTSGLFVGGAQVLPTQPVYCRSTISEFQISASNPNIADPTTERVLLAYDKPQDNHNGSQLAFDSNGYLYISAGDGGSQHDNDFGHTGGYANAPIKAGNMGNAQDTTKLLGKVLCIDPFGTNGPTGSYGIPASNPFATTGGGVRPEIFTFGMRNPWRFCFDTDPNLGTRIIEADVGQNDVEEINLLTSGGNYGWRIMEGSFAHDNTAPSGGGTLINPVAQYFHPTPSVGFPSHFPKIGTSIIGGYVYRGSAIPSLVGQYVFGDYSAIGVTSAPGVIMTINSSTWALSQSSIIGTFPLYLTSFGVDESGELYVLGKLPEGPVDNAQNQPTGVVYKIVPAQVGQVNFATLTPSQDNSLFAESPGNSDAQGFLYAGEDSSGNIRRGLLEFNLASQLPSNATAITSAQLFLNMNSTSATAAARMSIYRLTESWGQGTSGPSAGAGSPATENDATWTDRFYDPTSPITWTTAGGTHVTTASAANTSVGTATGYYTWNATASSLMLSDLNGWLNATTPNNGWLFEGSESSKNSVRRFDSMTSASGVQPTLLVTYTTTGQLTWRESWLQTYFSPAGIVGNYVNDQADPSNDGLNNLLDYAFGYSPLVANLGYSPTVSTPATAGIQTSLTTSGGNDTYTMTFLCDPRATDLTYQLQSSNDLVNWTTIVQCVGGGTPTGSAYVSETAQPGAAPVQVVTAVETLPAPVKHFSRLVVTRAYQQQ